MSDLNRINMKRIWAMPNKHTFLIKPIEELVNHYAYRCKRSIDPFSGRYSPADVRNDLNPEIPANFHMDALEFLKGQKDDSFDLGLYDPPYSMRQASECYKKVGLDKQTATVTNWKYWKNVKDELARKIEANGYTISCGWNSNGLGINRGFMLDEILLVPHGGGHYDTIVTVERKIQTTLKEK